MTVYVACPSNCFTGGPTLLHQFCAELNAQGTHAEMAYYVGAGSGCGDPVHPRYKRFQCPHVMLEEVEDSFGNWIVFPETGISRMRNYHNSRKAIWWLSVDNYVLGNLSVWQKIGRKITKDARIESYIDVDKLRRRYEFTDRSVSHFVQSEYARSFLYELGVSRSDIFDLSDYIDESYLSLGCVDSCQRSDVVLYNPKKMGPIVSDLVLHCPEISTIALQGMTEDQLVELMRSSKIYVDFGNFPGKDRLPREAALCGCCVVTGKRGAASNAIDFAIPGKYKLDDDSPTSELVRLIQSIFSSFEESQADFDDYRKKIKAEKAKFLCDVGLIRQQLLESDAK